MPETHDVAIIGAGAMGHGFAAHFGLHEQSVTLIDHRRTNLDRAESRIRRVVDFLRAEGVTDRSPDAVIGSIDMTLDEAAGVASADIVLETVTEDLEAKRDVFTSVAPAAPADAVLASNTSGIPITQIAAAVPDAAERVAGCHWWYPPYLLPTVEVVRGEETTDATMARLESFAAAVDRSPITVERDVPGFVWNRIQVAIFREALHLAETGVASLADINRAVRDGYALRTAAIGPIETMDIAGLDLVRTVVAELSPHLSDADEPSPLLADRLAEGRGGIEDGAGFFEYDRAPAEITADRDRRVMAIRKALAGIAGPGAE